MNDTPHNAALLSELRCRAWALSAPELGRLRDLAMTGGAGDGMASAPPRRRRSAPEPICAVTEGVAIIGIKGILLKNPHPAYQDLGIDTVSSCAVGAAMEAAVAARAVKAILLAIDSPGGEVRGTQALADLIFAARRRKPVHAAIEDEGCSAAYWLASQAQTVAANRSAHVGSIGVHLAIDDLTARFHNAGIRTNLIASGPQKGTGVPGAPVTPERLDPLSEWVTELAAVFIADVARGRGREPATVAGWADGRFWPAEQALGIGLIDRVETSAATFARVARAA